MKQAIKHIAQITLGIWVAFSIMSIVANKIPWYTQELPLSIEREVYYAGQEDKVSVGAIIERKALVGMKAKNLIELVHVHNGEEREVYKYSKDIYLQKGRGSIEVYYDVPPKSQCEQLESNTYKFRGIITYHPFGYLEKSFEWETELFQIEVPKKPDA